MPENLIISHNYVPNLKSLYKAFKNDPHFSISYLPSLVLHVHHVSSLSQPVTSQADNSLFLEGLYIGFIKEQMTGFSVFFGFFLLYF